MRRMSIGRIGGVGECMGADQERGLSMDRDCHARSACPNDLRPPAYRPARSGARAHKKVCAAPRSRSRLFSSNRTKMPRPRWPRRRTGMILGLAEDVRVIPGNRHPRPWRRLHGSCPTPDRLTLRSHKNLSRIVSCFRSERLAGVVSRLTTFVPAALAWSFAIRAKNQPPRCKTVNTSTTPQADQLGVIIPKRLA